MNMVFHPCLKCLIGLKVRIAVKQFGIDCVSEELDQDVRSIMSNYTYTKFEPDPVREYLNDTFGKQCSQDYL